MTKITRQSNVKLQTENGGLFSFITEGQKSLSARLINSNFPRKDSTFEVLLFEVEFPCGRAIISHSEVGNSVKSIALNREAIVNV